MPAILGWPGIGEDSGSLRKGKVEGIGSDNSPERSEDVDPHCGLRVD